MPGNLPVPAEEEVLPVTQEQWQTNIKSWTTCCIFAKEKARFSETAEEIFVQMLWWTLQRIYLKCVILTKRAVCSDIIRFSFHSQPVSECTGPLLANMTITVDFCSNSGQCMCFSSIKFCHIAVDLSTQKFWLSAGNIQIGILWFNAHFCEP